MPLNMGFEAFPVGTSQLLMRASTPPLSAPLQKSLLPWPCPGDCLFSPETSFVLLVPPPTRPLFYQIGQLCLFAIQISFTTLSHLLRQSL